MIWTGLAIAGFLVYHLLHFTVQVLHPEAAAATHADALGRPDVHGMLVAGFRNAVTAAVYAVGMVALGLHLFHGIASSVQTFGLNGPRSFPWLERAGVSRWRCSSPPRSSPSRPASSQDWSDSYGKTSRMQTGAWGGAVRSSTGGGNRAPARGGAEGRSPVTRSGARHGRRSAQSTGPRRGTETVG